MCGGVRARWHRSGCHRGRNLIFEGRVFLRPKSDKKFYFYFISHKSEISSHNFRPRARVKVPIEEFYRNGRRVQEVPLFQVMRRDEERTRDALLSSVLFCVLHCFFGLRLGLSLLETTPVVSVVSIAVQTSWFWTVPLASLISSIVVTSVRPCIWCDLPPIATWLLYFVAIWR